MTAAPPTPEPDVLVDVPVAEGVVLHTRRWHGPAGAFPFVLLHGLSSNARLWDGVAAALARAGHGVVAVDQRGHGRSSRPADGYDMATVSDDLRTLLDVLADEAGASPPVLVGQSWGGNVVIELAARFPGRARAVACVDGGAIDLRRRFADWEACAAALRPPPLTGTPLARIEAMLRHTHPDWPEEGIRGTLACFEVREDGTVAPRLDVERHLLVLRGLWDHDPFGSFRHITEPVLFLNAGVGGEAGEDARAGGAAEADAMARARELLPRVRIEWMAGDHDLHAQFPGQVAERLLEFAHRPPAART